ncbi:UNVERIFIED_CONTAM: hypothetical protein FKN15_043682 [Acipenser sinensis]
MDITSCSDNVDKSGLKGGQEEVMMQFLRLLLSEKPISSNNYRAAEKFVSPRTTQAKQLEEKDRDLRKQDAYYKEQLARLEDRSAQFYKVTTEQYQKSVTEVEAKFKRYESHPVCADLQGEILRCYQASNGQTLGCSTLARQYLQCVNNAKQVRNFQQWEGRGRGCLQYLKGKARKPAFQ